MLNEILLKLVQVEMNLSIVRSNIKKAEASGDKKRLYNELFGADDDLEVIIDKITRVRSAISHQAQALHWLENWLT